MKHERKLVRKWSEVLELVEHVKTTGYCSFDFETCGSFYEGGWLTMFGISFQPGSAWVMPMKHPESPLTKYYHRILRLFQKEVFENPKVIKIAFNIQFELCWLRTYGIIPRGILMDAMLAKYLLNEERPNDLGYVSGYIFPEFSGFKDDTEKLAKKHGWGNIPLQPLYERNSLDCDLTLRLMLYFEERLISLGFYPLFRNLLMMMARTLSEVSFFGIDIDTKYLSDLSTSYLDRLRELEERMTNNPRVLKYKQFKDKTTKKALVNNMLKLLEEPGITDRVRAGRKTKLDNYLAGIYTTKKDQELFEPFNFKSGKQLIDFLFYNKKGLRLEPLMFTVNKKTKKVSETPAVNEEHLQKLHEYETSGFISALLEYNKAEHIYSTYVKGIEARTSINAKVHTSFLIHGTVTGRLSSKNPNLQNIPRGTTAKDIKMMFIPPPGYVILEVDYSQAELRLVAELSKDEAMIDIFKRGYNIHVATACKINGQMDNYNHIHKVILKDPKHPDNLFWEKQKKRAKLINFGILYGQTEKKLSIELDCSEKEALEFINQWFNAYPQAKKWIDRQQRKAMKQGYVKNIFGRKRRLPNAQMSKSEAKLSGLYGYWLEALRQSVNAPIQGGSSDLTQFASVIVREKILNGELPKSIRQIYTVHDSIGYIVKPHLLHEVIPPIVSICANPDTMKYFKFKLEHVNMKVSPEIGMTSWGSLEEYDSSRDYSKYYKELHGVTI